MTPGDRFEELYRAFDHTTSASDPVHIVRRFSTPADREVVGFCAAGLAFGVWDLIGWRIIGGLSG